MKAVVDFIPWLSPSAIDASNYRWTFYHELSDEQNREFRTLLDRKRRSWLDALSDQSDGYDAIPIKRRRQLNA